MTEAERSLLLRELAPRVLGALVRRHGDLATCEDARQEALLVASEQWARTGPPRDPLAWLLQVANRRLIDLVRAASSRRLREQVVASLVPQAEPPADELIAADRDDSLYLFFLCCQPALRPASATALTLRALGGLSTAEIARAFLVPEATMAQRLSRARSTLKQSGLSFTLGEAEQRARLPEVMRVLYLIFNEGYASTSGAAVHRVDLCREAIRLARMLCALVPREPEVMGLLALLLLTDARRDARTGPRGELVPLDEQDRKRWDRAAITEGSALIDTAFSLGAAGPYQIQAAIASLHDEAPSTEATDWRQIAALYGVLLRMRPSPLVALNQAVAVAMYEGPAAGLVRLDALRPELQHNHRYLAARAHLFERAGQRAEALTAYEAAAAATTSQAERDYLWLKAARLRSTGGA